MTKLGRNDKCHCGSGKKYKKCCFLVDQEKKQESAKNMDDLFKNGHKITEEVKDMYEYFTTEYPDFKVIDVTNIVVGKGSYKKILTKHYHNNTIMLVARNEKNDRIFKDRGSSWTNLMVMFKGAHQVFSEHSFKNMKPQLKTMIKRRMNNENYSY